jgi:YhhN family
MAFTAGRNYLKYPAVKKIIWRLILLLPLALIIFPNTINSHENYKILLLSGFILIIAADMAIIFDWIAGLLVFLLYHTINIINYCIIAGNNFPGYLIFCIPVILVIWFIIQLAIFTKKDFKKYLAKNKTASILENPIYPKMLLFIYFSSILLSVFFSFAIFFNAKINFLFPLFASTGAFIFFIGDYFLFYDVLKNNGKPFHQILNNTLYYIPLIFYALLTVIK